MDNNLLACDNSANSSDLIVQRLVVEYMMIDEFISAFVGFVIVIAGFATLFVV